jgi:hypothetical protein
VSDGQAGRSRSWIWRRRLRKGPRAGDRDEDRWQHVTFPVLEARSGQGAIGRFMSQRQWPLSAVIDMAPVFVFPVGVLLLAAAQVLAIAASPSTAAASGPPGL